MKRIFALVIGLLLTLSIIPVTAEEVQLSFTMWDEEQSPVIQENIDKFNELHKGEINVKLELVPWSDFWTKLDASLPTGDAADVMWMNVYVTKYAPADLLLPLDELIAAENFDLSQYIQGKVDGFTVDGKLYALPKGLDSVFVAYNTEIFDR